MIAGGNHTAIQYGLVRNDSGIGKNFTEVTVPKSTESTNSTNSTTSAYLFYYTTEIVFCQFLCYLINRQVYAFFCKL